MTPEEQAVLETPHVTVGYMRVKDVNLEVWSVSANEVWVVTIYGKQDEPEAVVLQRHDLKTAAAMIEMLGRAIEVCQS